MATKKEVNALNSCETVGVMENNIKTVVINAVVQNTGGQPLRQEVNTRLLTNLEQKLTDKYKTMTLQTMSWMDQGRLEIKAYFVPLQLTNSENTCNISLEEIFECNRDDVPPKRILIEAPPGFGKTTLAHKIIYDWAVKCEYTKYFKFAFLITLGDLQQGIPEKLTEIAETCGFDKTGDVKNIIGENAEKTLIVLDGLDELNVDCKIHILKLLYKSHYCDVTIVATCRTGAFIVTNDERDQISEDVAIKSEFHDKKINVCGLDDTARRTLLTILVGNDETINGIEMIIKPIAELFLCPLFVILLAYIVDENPGIIFATKTKLLKYLVDNVIRHNLSKLDIPLPHNFSIFSNVATWQSHRDLFLQFGKLSAQRITESKSVFDYSDETDAIYKMGLLIKQKITKTYSTNYNFEELHSSILEFAVAYWMLMEFEKNNGEFGEIAENIILKHQQFRSSSLILDFLGELLDDEMLNEILRTLIRYQLEDSRVLSQVRRTVDSEERSRRKSS